MLEDPTVPVDKLMPSGAQTALIVAAALGFVAIWLYAIRESRRRNDLVPVYIVLGAGLAIYYEPLGDALAQVYYPERGQETWIHAFGRDIPVFIGLLYFWYMAAGSMWLLRASQRGVAAREWWTFWGGFLAVAMTIELVGSKVLATDTGSPWIYHGDQAFVVMDVPFFTPWTYTAIDMTVAAGAVAVAHVLPRNRQWLLLPFVPMLMAAGHLMPALPTALALHSTDSDVLIHLGALGSAAFVLTLSYVFSLAYRRPWGPALLQDRGQRERPQQRAHVLRVEPVAGGEHREHALEPLDH